MPEMFLRGGAALGRAARHAGLLAGLCSSCASEPAPQELGRRSSDIIGGELGAAAELNHTGALIRTDRQTLERSAFCTATLIGPETLVTAKHCVLPFAEYAALGFEIAWLVGPTVSDPLEIIPIAAAVTAPVNQGGFLDVGQDVATLHLEHPTSIPPAVPTLLTSDELGQSMLSIGYGMFTSDGERDGRRRIGHETVIATEGRTYEALFGSFENFVEWALTGQTTAENILLAFSPGDLLGTLILASYRRDFDALLLLEEHEAVTGRTPGDTQTCFGDSGGPLARLTEDGTWQTLGVVSGGLYSARSVCDYGTVVANFGPESLAFVMAALQWVDPCGDVSARGECRGSAALRCETNLGAGQRDLVQLDCAALGQACVEGPSGAACEDAPPPTANAGDAAASEADAPNDATTPSPASASDAGAAPDAAPP